MKLETSLPMHYTVEEWNDFSLEKTEQKISTFVKFLPNIIPAISETCIVYGNYYANYISCVLRQLVAPIKAMSAIAYDVVEFFKCTVKLELEELLQGLIYSYSIYYNHLNSKQQHRQQPVIDNENLLMKYFIQIFCKGEKQPAGGKTRTVSQVCESDKFVLGPICYAVELMIVKKLLGYGPGKSWQDLNKFFKKCKEMDLIMAATDFDGYDRSVQVIMKMIHFISYEMFAEIASMIKDGPFTLHALSRVVKIMLDNNKLPEKFRSDLNVIYIVATVFSGKSCTTLLNTIVTIVCMRYINEVLIKLQRHQYMLTVCGDDALNGLPKTTGKEFIKEAYLFLFVDKKLTSNKLLYPLINHGVGFILKDLVITEIDDAIYCSTSNFYCHTCNNYRMFRDLEKFCRNLPYSIKGSSLNKKDFMAYMRDIAEAEYEWIGDLPIFGALNSLRHFDTKHVISSKEGERKKHVRLEQHEQEFLDNLGVIGETFYGVSVDFPESFDTDDKYSLFGKQQELCCDCKSYFITDVLERRYGINESEIPEIERQILELPYTNQPIDRLAESFVYYNEFRASLSVL